MLNLYQITPGQKVRLKDGRVGEVRENMEDGQWLGVHFPEMDDDEEPELVHSQDLAEVVSEAS